MKGLLTENLKLTGKKILLRLDLNVPLKDKSITELSRIEKIIPTIKFLLKKKSKIIILSHIGRPKGKEEQSLSLIPVGEELAGLLEMPIKFSANCISTDAIDTSISLKPGEIHLLENLRFHSEEEDNDADFSSQLARHGNIYINDAFGTAHRSHASNVGVVPFFKNAGIGWLMDKELNYLDRLMNNPKRPLTLVLGGSKIDTKLSLIDKFLDNANHIIIGGGMAFTFLKARGKSVGGSLVDEKMLDTAKRIINKARVKGVKLSLPIDVICGSSPTESEAMGTFLIQDIPDDYMGLDIGPETLNIFNSIPIAKFLIAPLISFNNLA